LTVIVTVAALVAGCGWLPRMHRVTVQQGNVITQDMVDQLKPGMTRRQVAFIMGEPVVRNSFNPNRWDYVYSIVIPNVGTQNYRLSLFFDQDVLAFFTGDFAPTDVDRTAPTEPTPPTEPTAPKRKLPRLAFSG
jgi:outer membrane protein assembly factor BamE